MLSLFCISHSSCIYVYCCAFRRGISGMASSRLIKPGRAGSLAPSGVDQDSLQDESSLDGEDNSSAEK